MPAPVAGWSSVRCVTLHTAAAAGAPRRAGQGDRDTVGGEPGDPGAGGVRGDGVRDEPGHALRPLGPPGTCLAAVAPRDGGRERRALEEPSTGLWRARRLPRRLRAGARASTRSCGRPREPDSSSGDRAAARGRIRREGALSRLARANNPARRRPEPPHPVWAGREDARPERQLPEVAREEAFRCALCSWFWRWC